MKNKTIEEILENVKKQVQSLMMSTPYELSKETKIITQADQEIKELIKAKLPKEIPIPSEPLSPFKAGELSGFNIAIAEIRRAIDES